jgi:hypothetical protein
VVNCPLFAYRRRKEERIHFWLDGGWVEIKLTRNAHLALLTCRLLKSWAAPGSSSDPLRWTLTEAAAALASGKVSSEELTKLCYARIAKLEAPLNAFITKDVFGCSQYTGYLPKKPEAFRFVDTASPMVRS